MKQKTKLAVMAMVAAGILVPAIYIACTPGTTSDASSRFVEVDATSWRTGWVDNIPIDYTKYVLASVDEWHATSYYRVTWNQSQIESFLGTSLSLANGSSVIVRGTPANYVNGTVCPDGTTYLFRHVNGYFYAITSAISFLNKTLHEAVLLGMAW